MFGSNTGRHLIALIGAILMSSVAVGSAVAPAATSTQAVTVNA
jgi:hypothetical protein